MIIKKPTSFRFDEGTLELIDDLSRKNNLGSRAKTIEKAVAALNVLTSADTEGKEIILKGTDGSEQRMILI